MEQRLQFIEFRVFWEGGVNRSDLIETFGISVPQASKDLSLYQGLAPGNVIYDKSGKQYLVSASFRPRFLVADPADYLSRMRSMAEGLTDSSQSWLAQVPLADIALTPRREVSTEVLRELLRVIREVQSVEILYQSMNKARPDPLWRRITPHAFGYDGFRWHSRAFCHLENRFKDFLLPRMLGIRDADNAGETGEKDRLWHDYFDIEIAAHPGLAESQQKVVGIDFGFEDGVRILSVRYAMLFYVLKRLGLLGHPEDEDPRRQHIVAVNQEEIEAALELAETGEPASSHPESALARRA